MNGGEASDDVHGCGGVGSWFGEIQHGRPLWLGEQGFYGGDGWNPLGQRCGLQHAIDIYRLTDMGLNKHGCYDVKRPRFSLNIKC
jgi:hypothetical protein